MKYEAKLNQNLILIKPLNTKVYKTCVARWNSIAKPIHGLGEFEDCICKIGAILEDDSAPISPACAAIFCADHGVVSEGVSQTDESVTKIVCDNLANGISTLNIMANAIDNFKVLSIDVGVKSDIDNEKVIKCKIKPGTDNIAKGAAMSRDDAISAILTGIDTAKNVKDLGYKLIVSGEMGIGNTTPSSALASVILGIDPDNVTGRGAGLNDELFANKREVVRRAISVNEPDSSDPIDMLSKIGGLEIAAMTGLFLGGAIYHIPVVIDGVISLIAANLANMLAPDVKDYMIPSHAGKEPACKLLMDRLGIKPLINGNMALGEGTGAIMLLPLLNMVKKLYDRNITFGDINMEAYTDYSKEN